MRALLPYREVSKQLLPPLKREVAKRPLSVPNKTPKRAALLLARLTRQESEMEEKENALFSEHEPTD